jgi:predicted membrane chloride channel (bestrophin family)
MHRTVVNAILLMIPSVIPAILLERYADNDHWHDYQFGAITLPFVTLVGLMTAFRVNDAFAKWKSGRDCIEALYTKSCEAIMRLCSCIELNEETEEEVLRCRRLLVLGCMLIQKHVRHESGFDAELACGLITQAELEQVLLARLSVSAVEGKVDRYPSKARPRYAFFLLLQTLWQMNQNDRFKTVHYHLNVEACVYAMGAAFDDMVTLGETLMPIPYAQVSRFISIIFLFVLPFSLVDALHWYIIPVCFTSNLIYLTVSLCASEMEAPFGTDENDVDVSKLVRRLDKHTAAIMALWLGKPTPNFDLNPESQAARRVQSKGLKGATEKSALLIKEGLATEG